MFDPDTSKLIASAPALDGLDLDSLPEELTKAYASIVTARMRLREIAEGPAAQGDIDAVATKLRRIAYTNEAFVSSLPERENRAAAAFVAGAAHHVALMARRVNSAERIKTRLRFDSIDPEVSATLLFMVAEASADAAEVAKEILVPGDELVERALLQSIIDLAKGDLTQLITRELPQLTLREDHGLADQAALALFHMLLRGLRTFAQELLGSADPSDEPGTALALFRSVQRLSVESLEIGTTATFSVFPGPHHLASLLASVADNLPEAAVVNIKPPRGLDGLRWGVMLKKISKRRPYLWKNHRAAVSDGYLEIGTSSAVSFPTGAGKSTLSELKIASTLLAGKKIIFLAPTLALVEQTTTSLKSTFPTAAVQRERGDTFAFDDFSDELPEISIMTPEKCLVLMGYEPETFADVGLFVFDECHLMHSSELEGGQRALDAMLCVVNLVVISPSADLLLLSAMMKNTTEIAGWIESITGRRCCALNLTWKPTRQVRGCVVYDAARIDELNAVLRKTRATAQTKGVPAAVKRTLTAQPLGLFSLRQTWESKSRAHYELLPLIDDQVPLGTSTGPSWYLTPNGNKLASTLAAATARQNLKTLVFVQTIPLANAAAMEVNAQAVPRETMLTPNERLLLAEAVEELGNEAHLYIGVRGAEHVTSSSVCHHSLLLPSERRLHESLFSRSDGIRVMVATSTLAQGMNLPAEIVIIGGDSRFDREANKIARLEAHELLNAAGRAGRAGESAHGFVLVVPSKVVHFRDTKNEIGKHWADLRTIFAQSDQCLEIDDPLTMLLDIIQMSAEDPPPLARYLLSRLPVGDNADKDAPARRLLTNSFAAYRKKVENNDEWIEERVRGALVMRSRESAASSPTWVQRLSAATGVSTELLAALGEALKAVVLPSAATVTQLRDWYLDWLGTMPQVLPHLFRPATLEAVMGKSYAALTDDESRGRRIQEVIRPSLKLWMSGAPLAAIERVIGPDPEKLHKCDTAREFVIRLVPELGFVFGVPLQVLRALRKGTAEEGVEPGLSLATLSACVRGGFDDADQLALRQALAGRYSRVSVHSRYSTIKALIAAPNHGENFSDAVQRVKAALR